MFATSLPTLNLKERLDQVFEIFFMDTSGKKTLKEIVYECRFGSFREFLFEFREHFGCDPWEYRARLNDEIHRDWFGDGEDDLFESNWM